MLMIHKANQYNAVYKLNLLVILSHNSCDRRQIYPKSNSARNYTINERTLAISVSNKVIEKNKALNIFEGLFIAVMIPLARFAHKYDKLNRTMKLHKNT